MKAPKQLERYYKGVSNHWRISILLILEKEEGLTLDQISGLTNGNFKTISHHTASLMRAGLINKKYKGRNVCHFLSPFGKLMLKSFKTF